MRSHPTARPPRRGKAQHRPPRRGCFGGGPSLPNPPSPLLDPVTFFSLSLVKALLRLLLPAVSPAPVAARRNLRARCRSSPGGKLSATGYGCPGGAVGGGVRRKNDQQRGRSGPGRLSERRSGERRGPAGRRPRTVEAGAAAVAVRLVRGSGAPSRAWRVVPAGLPWPTPRWCQCRSGCGGEEKNAGERSVPAVAAAVVAVGRNSHRLSGEATPWQRWHEPRSALAPEPLRRRRFRG